MHSLTETNTHTYNRIICDKRFVFGALNLCFFRFQFRWSIALLLFFVAFIVCKLEMDEKKRACIRIYLFFILRFYHRIVYVVKIGAAK